MTRPHPLPLILLLVGALSLALWASTPPKAVGAGAGANAFSATRAMEVLAEVARAPHPIGSPEAAAVRAGLTRRMRALGMDVTPLRRVAVAMARRGERSAQAGRGETLVGVLPGRDPALPAIAVMVHSDSVPGSFGAADDGAGVAVALESVRAIAAGPRPVRDVMLIVTDGEEAGLLGARAFFADPVWAKRVGAIVNIDARGTAGLGAMFETGPGSGGLIGVYRAHATHRFAHSAATFLYRQLPNSTDLTAAMPRGLPALNFAFLDGEFDYHTPRDRLASMDPRTLQSLGDQVLPVVRAVAAQAVLPPRGADGVFGDTALFAVRYPAWVGWPLLGVALLLGGWGVRGARWWAAVRAGAATLAVGATSMLMARLGYGLTGVGEDWAEHHRIMAAFGRYEAGLGLIALGCVLAGWAALRRTPPRWLIVGGVLTAGAVAALLGRPAIATAVIAGAAAILAALAIGARIETREVRAGTLGVGLLLSLIVQVLAPPLTPLLLWPTLIAAGAAAAARRWPDAAWADAALGLLPLAYMLVFAHATLLALGVPKPEAVGLFALVAAVIVAPLVGRGALRGAALAGAVGLALLLSFRWSGPSERYPALSQLWGVVADGRTWRVSTLERPDPWTRAALAADGGAIGRGPAPIIADGAVWRAAARPLAMPVPSIVLDRRGDEAAVTVSPAQAGRELRLLVSTDRALDRMRVEGAAAAGFGARPGQWRLRWRSAGEPVTLRFHAPPGMTLGIVAGEVTERRLAPPARPATVVPWLGSDRIIVTNRARWRL